ncbi:MAG: mannose-6-phosphate isomerase-like protein (cupin superfamily) [Planctomycetota bacterium]|jgi:mannose-6-phosphate isomerase-like protein (cupin superfamily)
MEAIDLDQKFATFDDCWSPRIIADINDQQVKLARLDGEFVWHEHANEDEFFLVLEGRLEIHFRDSITVLTPGQLCVVPKGVEHKPNATLPTKILLIERATTKHTGTTETPRANNDQQRI